MKGKTRMMRALWLAFLFPLGLIPLGLTIRLGSQQANVPSLQAEAERLVSGGGDWGIMAWSIDRNQPLISINASEPRTPASNNKVFTAIWALDELGPDYRFETDLLITGPISNGVLQGDVILRGAGDPAFGYPPRLGYSEFVEDPMAPLQKMAARLAQLGVRQVQGGVIGDATAFDTVLVGPSWPNDTGGGAAQYAPRVSGLPFQRNMIWVEARARPGGGPADIRVSPAVAVVPVLSTVRSGGGRALAVRRPDEDTIRISGGVSGSAVNRLGVGVADPALMTADALRQALAEVGIQVSAPTRLGATPEGATLVHQHYSIPLGQMIPFLNQHSDNFFAEHLWKAAARKALGQGNYRLGGPASALHFIHRAGVKPGELYQFDGSGLSSYSRITAQSMVRALVYANSQPYSELFHKSLAVAADRNGTMNRMYVGSAAAGNLHAKTGYIRRVRTLSGYVRARNGELIAFSFLYNGANTNGARAIQQDLGVLLANYGG